MEKSIKVLSHKKTYAENNYLKIYPLVLKLYLSIEVKFFSNKGVYDFLNASINYHFDNEWRTSIVLSSIATESILAELYEEKYRKSPPDIPLGGLKKLVEKKISFPDNISDKINDMNECRIASVHRSENPVNDKESIIAMMGVISLVIWYLDY